MFDDSVPLDGHAALTIILPSYAVLYIEAALVQLSGTRLLRLALLPCGLYFMLQSAKVDQTSMFPDNYKSRLTYFNLGNITIMLTLAMQLVTFAIAPKPLYRTDQPPSRCNKLPLCTLLSNALDLMFNARGIGWNWGTSIPKPTYPTRSRWHAILYSLTSFILHTLLVDAVLSVMYALNPALRNPEGASMFLDHTGAPLSPLHTTAIALCMGTTIYAAVVYPYDAVRITALLLGGDPARWPPLFDAPWAATSLKDLWGRRWHQMFRHSFVVLGAGPGRAMGDWVARVMGIPLGRILAVLGAFALSSLLHSLPLHGMGRGGDALRISVFFMMMGAGIISEDIWSRFTGRSVSGLPGWIWTYTWLLGWGHFLVEAYCQKGIAGALWFRIVTFSLYGIPEHA
ncbi:membrane bound O-acyl transferase family-domain-containing protein [Schizophyllum commune]